MRHCTREREKEREREREREGGRGGGKTMRRRLGAHYSRGGQGMCPEHRVHDLTGYFGQVVYDGVVQEPQAPAYVTQIVGK